MRTERLEYCGGAEPNLLHLRDKLAAGTVEPLVAARIVSSLVGRPRFEADWTKAQKACPPDRDPALFALECFETAHPRGDKAHRLYPGPCSRRLGADGVDREHCGCVKCDCLRALGVMDAVVEQEKAQINEAKAAKEGRR